MIEQLVSRIAAQVGIPEATARQGVGVVMGMLKKEGDPGAVGEIFAKVPGAEALADRHAGASSGAGGGLMGKLGGMMGGKAGSGMSALAAFQKTGLTPEQGKQMVPIAKDFFAEQVGRDTMTKALGSVPALKGFVS